MKSRYFSCLLFLLFISVSQFVRAQSGGGWGGRDSGLFTTANPAKTGRYITVGGRLIPTRKIEHSISVSGYVQSILVSLGNKVEPGQALVSISRDVVGETFLPVVLESRIRGIVSEINVYEKQEVHSGTAAVTILDTSGFLLKTSLSDRDARAVRSLGAIRVTGTTPEGEEFQGRIQQVSQEPDYETGLFTLAMTFPGQTGLYIGMVLFVDLAVSKEEGITIEKSAVLEKEGKSFVWILSQEKGLTLTEISTGDEIESKIIVESGLTPEERFVKQLSGKEKEGMDPKELIRANMGDKADEGNH